MVVKKVLNCNLEPFICSRFQCRAIWIDFIRIMGMQGRLKARQAGGSKMNLIKSFLKGMKKRRIKKTVFMVLLITLVSFSIGSFLNKQAIDTQMSVQENFTLNVSDLEQSMNSIVEFEQTIELNKICLEIQSIDLSLDEIELGVDLRVIGTVEMEVLSCFAQ